MNQKTLTFGLIGFLIGIFFTLLFMMNTNRTTPSVITTGPHESHDMGTAMDSMTQALFGKNGEEFDKVFLSEMIVHHDGAVEMAKQALNASSHEEIRELSRDIISAQEKEIGQMKAWQKEWGYEK